MTFQEGYAFFKRNFKKWGNIIDFSSLLSRIVHHLRMKTKISMNKISYTWIIYVLGLLIQFDFGQAQNYQDLAEEIRDHIVPQIGNYKFLRPEISTETQQDEPASTGLVKGEGVIYLDKDLFTLLRKHFSMETAKSCLAFMVAHELDHYYYHHSYLQTLKNLSPQERIPLEIHADQEGFFQARLAGYPLSLDSVKTLFQVIYEAYPELNQQGYPSIEERLKASQQAIDNIQAKNLPTIFRLASFLQAQGQYSHAIRCLKYVYNNGYSHESISNNLGAVSLAGYLRSLPANQVSSVFKYPLDFDIQQIRGGSSVQDVQFKNADDWKKEAFYYLDLAIKKKPDYDEAYNNLSIYYFAQGDMNNAQQQLNRIKLPSLQANVMQGIIYAWQNKSNLASNYFEEAAIHKSRVAQYNKLVHQEILEKGTVFKETARKLDNYQLELIQEKAEEKITSQTPYENLSPDQEMEVIRNQGLSWIEPPQRRETIQANPLLSIAFNNNPQANLTYKKVTVLYDNFEEDRKVKLHLLFVHPNFSGSSGLGISLGDSLDKLLNMYGRPDPDINPNLAGDSFYKYNDAGILFEVKDNQVVGWAWFWEEI